MVINARREKLVWEVCVRVVHNVGGFSEAVSGVDDHDRGKRDTGDRFSFYRVLRPELSSASEGKRVL